MRGIIPRTNSSGGRLGQTSLLDSIVQAGTHDGLYLDGKICTGCLADDALPAEPSESNILRRARRASQGGYLWGMNDRLPLFVPESKEEGEDANQSLHIKIICTQPPLMATIV